MGRKSEQTKVCCRGSVFLPPEGKNHELLRCSVLQHGKATTNAAKATKQTYTHIHPYPCSTLLLRHSHLSFYGSDTVGVQEKGHMYSLTYLLTYLLTHTGYSLSRFCHSLYNIDDVAAIMNLPTTCWFLFLFLFLLLLLFVCCCCCSCSCFFFCYHIRGKFYL